MFFYTYLPFVALLWWSVYSNFVGYWHFYFALYFITFKIFMATVYLFYNKMNLKHLDLEYNNNYNLHFKLNSSIWWYWRQILIISLKGKIFGFQSQITGKWPQNQYFYFTRLLHLRDTLSLDSNEPGFKLQLFYLSAVWFGANSQSFGFLSFFFFKSDISFTP